MPNLTEEQIQLTMRLQSIFMPDALRRREEVYERQTGAAHSRQPIRFAHYTSADAALKIIKSKRIWMRNTTCMADYREVQRGFDMVRGFFADKSKLESFTSALDTSVPGAAMEAIKLFNQWYSAGPSSIGLNTYIASVSAHQKEEDQHGRLSMWRAFGGSPRVSIVFAVPWYSGGADALNIIFSPVSYLTEPEVHDVLNEVASNVRGNAEFLKSIGRPLIVETVFIMLLAGVTCLKHEGFREELEWRAIYTPKIRSSQFVEPSTEVVAGVPQLIYKLPLDEKVSDVLADLDLARMFDRVIIGPSLYPWVLYEAFVGALREMGVLQPEQRVFISGIPIRG